MDFHLEDINAYAPGFATIVTKGDEKRTELARQCQASFFKF